MTRRSGPATRRLSIHTAANSTSSASSPTSRFRVNAPRASASTAARRTPAKTCQSLPATAAESNSRRVPSTPSQSPELRAGKRAPAGRSVPDADSTALVARSTSVKLTWSELA